jgi:hypothetical protein
VVFYILYIYFYRSDATQKLYKEAKDEVINEREWWGGYLDVTGLTNHRPSRIWLLPGSEVSRLPTSQVSHKYAKIRNAFADSRDTRKM